MHVVDLTGVLVWIFLSKLFTGEHVDSLSDADSSVVSIPLILQPNPWAAEIFRETYILPPSHKHEMIWARRIVCVRHAHDQCVWSCRVVHRKFQPRLSKSFKSTYTNHPQELATRDSKKFHKRTMTLSERFDLSGRIFRYSFTNQSSSSYWTRSKIWERDQKSLWFALTCQELDTFHLSASLCFTLTRWDVRRAFVPRRVVLWVRNPPESARLRRRRP